MMGKREGECINRGSMGARIWVLECGCEVVCVCVCGGGGGCVWDWGCCGIPMRRERGQVYTLRCVWVCGLYVIGYLCPIVGSSGQQKHCCSFRPRLFPENTAWFGCVVCWSGSTLSAGSVQTDTRPGQQHQRWYYRTRRRSREIRLFRPAHIRALPGTHSSRLRRNPLVVASTTRNVFRSIAWDLTGILLACLPIHV